MAVDLRFLPVAVDERHKAVLTLPRNCKQISKTQTTETRRRNEEKKRGQTRTLPKMYITTTKSIALLVLLITSSAVADFSPIFPRQSTYTCDAGYSVCNKHCMPSGSNC